MDEGRDFTTILRRCMAQARRTPTDLERLTGISARTIENWTAGAVRRPREMMDVLKVARALGLDALDATTLLCAAGYPSLATLWAQAQRADDGELLTLLAAWLPAAPAASPTRRAQLRAPVTDFFGRDDTISMLVSTLRRAAHGGAIAAIGGVRGMGGIGKTELAYLVAHQLADAFPDAQIVINLRGTSSLPLAAEQALQQIIHTFVPDEQLPEDLDALQQRACAVLHGQRVLILADDAHDAAQVRLLLPPPGCALLMTSRQRFMLPGMVTVDLEQLHMDEAARLLHTICPRLRADEAQTIAQACGYLPLALRVSSSILHNDPALLVADYIQRLADERQRLALLRDPDDRQLDVEASLALSYAQLDAAAQRMFRQLGVLVADFATQLALAVVEVGAERDAEALLHHLLRRNLVMYDAARARWRLHDLVRDLARNALETAGEAEAAWWRYAHTAVQIAQVLHVQYLAGGDGALAALAQFDVERPHIDAGRRWADEHAGVLEGNRLLLDAALATAPIETLRYDAQRERIPQWEHALAAARRLVDRHSEGRALHSLGTAYLDLGDARRASEYYEQRLTVARELGDRHGEGQTLNNMGNAYLELGDARRAISYYKQSLTIARAIDDWRTEGQTLNNMGSAYKNLGDARRAISYYEQSLTIARAIGDRRGEAIVLTNMGNTYADLDDARRAIESCKVALTAAREIGDQWLEGYALSYLAHAQVRQDDGAGTTAVFEQALAIFRTVGDRAGEAECNWQFGVALAQQGGWVRAVPLLRAAVAYEEEIGHAQAAEHAALLARLEAGEDVPAEMLRPAYQRSIGADGAVPMDDGV